MKRRHFETSNTHQNALEFQTPFVAFRVVNTEKSYRHTAFRCVPNESGYIFIKWNRFLNEPMVRLCLRGGSLLHPADVR